MHLSISILHSSLKIVVAFSNSKHQSIKPWSYNMFLIILLSNSWTVYAMSMPRTLKTSKFLQIGTDNFSWVCVWRAHPRGGSAYKSLITWKFVTNLFGIVIMGPAGHVQSPYGHRAQAARVHWKRYEAVRYWYRSKNPPKWSENCQNLPLTACGKYFSFFHKHF